MSVLLSLGVHDRETFQRLFEQGSISVGDPARQAAEHWVRARSRASSGANPFSRFFSDSLPELKESGQKTAVFFSSSRDELEGLGHQWGNFSWGGQYESFNVIGKHLLARGYKCVLRLHPNLLTKSSLDMSEEIEEIVKLKSLGFEIIGPKSPANSYLLAKSSDLVVVSRSTIGLESLTLGLPVIVSSNSYYDQLDVLLRVEDEADLSRVDTYLSNFDVNRAVNLAKEWLAAQWTEDTPIGESIKVAPTVLERVKNILNPRVAYYYASRTLIELWQVRSRKKLLERISSLE